MKVRFAVSPGMEASHLDGFTEAVVDLEALGFDTVWLSDIPLGSTLDPIVGLSFAAAATSSLKLGANVVPIGRNPVTLAKALAQVDQLSKGRLLLSFVVGLDQPGERQALGSVGANRGRLLEEVTPLLRAWWAGDSVTHGHDGDRHHFQQVASPGRSYQQPLEVWLGGSGPAALSRTGRFADGWLGSAMSPAEASVARQRIQQAAADSGRTIDPEHFGISIPYAAKEPDACTLELFRTRRPDADLADLLPVGSDHLRRLLGRYIDAGLSKFVIRPTGPVGDPHAAFGELADLVLPLQT